MARDFVFPMMRGAARYENRYMLGTSIARPCITKALIDIARKEGADAIAHGATGKGNDQVRFEFSAKALAPEIRVIAPWREWDLMSRTALTAFAEKHGIFISKEAKRYSMDANMLHTSFEGSELENPGNAPHEICHDRCVPVEQAPNEPEVIEVGFEAGNPVSVNGRKLSPYTIIKTLAELAGKHGIGRDDMVENRYVGMKCRGVYENPAGTLLFALHRDLEGICMDRELLGIRDMLAVPYSHAVYNGYWFSPEREAMQAFFDKSQETVTGTVRAKLYKGGVWPLARTSPYSLFSEDLATFEGGDYDHKDAAGFIRLNGLKYIISQEFSDEEILSEFVSSTVPARLQQELKAYIQTVRTPLAVRSSSKLEDSHYQPFAGIYSTYMIPYVDNGDQMLRLLLKAVKSVYASVYFATSRAYLSSSQNLISEEKMAVIIQEVCGTEQDGLFFPTFSGVARSINYYPIGDEAPADGVCNIAMGLGKLVVDGGRTLRFSPRYPQKVLQTSTPELALRDTQNEVLALSLKPEEFRTSIDDAVNLRRLDIAQIAELRNSRFLC